MRLIRTISDNATSEIVVNKSKFLGYLCYVETVDEVEDALFNIRRSHPKSTHVCYAYILNQPNREKYDDDGEPMGTAGKAMQQVLKNKNLTNVLAVSVRYFGGIKLGKGGLLRAYTNSLNATLVLVECVDKDKLSVFSFMIELSGMKSFEQACLKLGVLVVEKIFAEKVQFLVAVDGDELEVGGNRGEFVEKRYFDVSAL